MIWWLRASIILTRSFLSSLFTKWMSPLTSHHILLSMYTYQIETSIPISISHHLTRDPRVLTEHYHPFCYVSIHVLLSPDTSNAILWLHCHSYCASLILSIYLRVICILLYFLCTYNHIEYCTTYVTYCSWRNHGSEIPLHLPRIIYCISFCICHILMMLPYHIFHC